jgi:hypothetical protein
MTPRPITTGLRPTNTNDMHTSLSGGYKGLTGDAANIKQGDDFLSQIVPVIMASNAYKNHGVIILWWDESESDCVSGDNGDDFNHTIGEIVISPHAHRNVNGLPCASRAFHAFFRLAPLRLPNTASLPQRVRRARRWVSRPVPWGPIAYCVATTFDSTWNLR